MRYPGVGYLERDTRSGIPGAGYLEWDTWSGIPGKVYDAWRFNGKNTGNVTRREDAKFGGGEELSGRR